MQCTTLTSVYALFLCLYRTALYGIYNGLTKTFETVWFLMSGYGIYCLIRWGNYSSLSCLNLQDRTGYDGRAMGWCSTPILATGWQWGFKTWRSVMTSRVFGKEARNWKKMAQGERYSKPMHTQKRPLWHLIYHVVTETVYSAACSEHRYHIGKSLELYLRRRTKLSCVKNSFKCARVHRYGSM